MELFDERLFQFGKGDVAHTVFRRKERLQVFHRRKIAVPCVFRAVDADTPVQILREAAESGQQGAVTLPEPQPGVLHLLGRHIAFPVADIPIMTVDLRANIVQIPVDTVRFEASALGTAPADFPQTLRNRELRTELRNRAVDRDAAHDRNRRLCFFLVPFQVEQNLERAAHKLCFLRGTKLISAESPIKMNGNAIDGKSPFYEMRGIPEQGNVLETEPSFDDAAGWPFESFYRANRNEKQPDCQYHCAYLPVLRICCTFDGKSGAKPSACRFRGNDIWLC